ncbi:hypothetical protein FR483_n432L [Paramecium bursaria Chlorella virus FR483]|uniref:Uncharacterized protein n432L n=1 Tax=Paramecium bursaria Chlorella virus FR483 TaxID=399781 RepID=A7J7D6_PBCVF|nr:hypothetical protein FR483_n432L [Paramecium bursaria Chlorella virus FR483]ABT15717.1 hypothetical protein FR483_n432L [Paramecium bursaria Chlorella virus FR483]
MHPMNIAGSMSCWTNTEFAADASKSFVSTSSFAAFQSSGSLVRMHCSMSCAVKRGMFFSPRRTRSSSMKAETANTSAVSGWNFFSLIAPSMMTARRMLVSILNYMITEYLKARSVDIRA